METITKTTKIQKNNEYSIRSTIPQIIKDWYDLNDGDEVEWVIHLKDKKFDYIEFRPKIEEE